MGLFRKHPSHSLGPLQHEVAEAAPMLLQLPTAAQAAGNDSEVHSDAPTPMLQQSNETKSFHMLFQVPQRMW